MKIIIIFLFVLQSLCLSQTWKHLSSLPDSSDGPKRLLSDESNLYTVGTHLFDLVVNKSTDNGVSWETIHRLHTGIEYGAVHNVWKADFVDEKYFYLTFLSQQKIAKSTDGGKSFELIEFETYTKDVGFFNLKMYDYKTGVATQGDHIYITRDGWETHDSVDRFGVGMYYPQFIDERTVQYVYFRKNGSTQLVNFDIETQLWEEHFNFDGFTNDNFLDMDYTENGKGFLAGLRRNGNGDRATDIMYQSTDFGKSWTKTIDQDTEPNWGFNRVLFNDTINGFATGQFGKVIMTNDAGENWHYVEDLEFYEGSDTLYGPFRTELAWLNGKPYFISGKGELYTTDSDFFNLYDRFAISGKVTNEGTPLTVPFKIGSRVIYPQPDATYKYTKRHEGNYEVSFEPSHYFKLKGENNIISVVDKDVTANLEIERLKLDMRFSVNNKDNRDLSKLQFKVELETDEGKYYSIDTLIKYDELNTTAMQDLIANDLVKVTPIIPNEADYVLIPSSIDVDFRQDTTFYFDVYDKDNYTVSGEITQRGKPMKYISLVLINMIDGDYKFSTTDSLGNYRFFDVEESDYSIYITSEHYGYDIYTPWRYELTVDEHKESNDFVYAPNSSFQFTGRVTDREGKGIRGIQIKPFMISSIIGRDHIGVRTNADGYYASPYHDSKFNYDEEKIGFYPETDVSFSPDYQYPNMFESLSGYDFVLDTVITNVPYRLPNMLAVYPNPVRSILTIEGAGEITAKIYDITGSEVMVVKSHKVDVSALMAGVYFIKDEVGNTLSQFVKE